MLGHLHTARLAIVILNVHQPVLTSCVVAPIVLLYKSILLTVFIARWTLLYQQDPEIAEGCNVDCRKEFAFLRSCVTYLIFGLCAALYLIFVGLQLGSGRRTAPWLRGRVGLQSVLRCCFARCPPRVYCAWAVCV